ncbi:MAG: lytic transglycosylase domain-containing protein [Myxococcota bacterium]
MRRLVFAVTMGLSGGCAVGSSGSVESAPAVSAAPAPAVAEPEPAPAPAVEPEPEPEPAPAPVVEPEPEPEPEPEKMWRPSDEARILAIQPIVAAAAAEYGVDPYLVNGVIWVESKFNRKARNRSGARGLMQLMPKTAKSIGKRIGRPTKVYDAEFNVHAGTWYLSRLLAKFDGDQRLALASYVRGPTRIRSWVEEGRTDFPDSVEGFVGKVQRARAVFEWLGWPEGSDEPGDPEASDDPSPSAEAKTSPES